MINYIRDYWRYLTKDSLYPGCDLLRAIACLSVLAFHGNFTKAAKIGYWGVDLFFVLSGFLIYHRLYNAKMEHANWSSSFRKTIKFYLSRFFRIYPIYICVALFNTYTIYKQIHPLYMGMLGAVPLKELSISAFKALLLLYPIDAFGTPGSWSLAIEWWFYIFSPFIFIGVSYLGNKRKSIISLLIGLVLFFIMLRANLILRSSDIQEIYGCYFKFESHLEPVVKLTSPTS